MDDISEKLAGLLNDPDTMERVRKMAENILGNEPSQPQAPASINNITDMFAADELSSIISIINQLKNSGNDPRSQLLTALKPHLSEPRREKVDTAIKILKILELLPIIKDSGLLKL